MNNEGDGKKGPGPTGGGKGPTSRREGSRDVPVAEEQPSMRAVALMSGQPLLIDSFDGNETPKRFAGVPSMKGLAPAELKKEPRAGLSVQHEWKGKLAEPSFWTVKTVDLEMADFPLERTHREIEGVEAEEICARISKVLRCLSIEAQYDDEKAKAKCRTSDYACFRIRLYAGRGAGQPVIVELQRRSGSTRSFMQSCRAILCAAEGQKPPTGEKKVPPFLKCPISNMKCLQGITPEVNRGAEFKFALDKVLELLRREQHDACVLAMESLCHLTDPIKTFPATAMLASKAVLTSDETCSLREDMASLLDRDGVAPDFHHIAVGGKDLADRLRHLTLLVFSNSLSLTAKDGSLERSVMEHRWFREFLIPTLVDEVRSAKTGPNNASVAVDCLVSLVSCSTVARDLVRHYNGLQVIGQAHEHGKQNHELLANETERFIKAIEETH